jgi:hypothetical protein
MPPQPSGAMPQFCPSAQAAPAVSGVHPQTFIVPPPPHVWGGVHVPHV